MDASTDHVELGERLVRDVQRPVLADVHLGAGEDAEALAYTARRIEAPDFGGLLPEIVFGAASICCAASERLESFGQGEWMEQLPLREVGYVDHFGVGAISPDGSTVIIVSLCKTSPPRVGEAVRRRWARVTAHILTGLRLRDSLAKRADEAVLDPAGKTLHAEGEACSKSLREVLRAALPLLQASSS